MVNISLARNDLAYPSVWYNECRDEFAIHQFHFTVLVFRVNKSLGNHAIFTTSLNSIIFE